MSFGYAQLRFICPPARQSALCTAKATETITIKARAKRSDENGFEIGAHEVIKLNDIRERGERDEHPRDLVATNLGQLPRSSSFGFRWWAGSSHGLGEDELGVLEHSFDHIAFAWLGERDKTAGDVPIVGKLDVHHFFERGEIMCGYNLVLDMALLTLGAVGLFCVVAEEELAGEAAR